MQIDTPSPELFASLAHILERPRPFERYTAHTLWADPHISAHMLAAHLDPHGDRASRRHAFIDASVAWLAGALRLGPGARVIDFGCGPGLYASRLARLGARVTGVDFSPRSIAYARAQAAADGLDIDYVEQSYLDYTPAPGYDAALLIFCDYCALAPEQRATLLGRVAAALRPGGLLLLDVHTQAGLARCSESISLSASPQGGFWAAEPHYTIQQRLIYPAEQLLLDRYTVVRAAGLTTICNWLQHFAPAQLAAELAAAGLALASLHGDVAGAPYDADGDLLAALARRA